MTHFGLSKEEDEEEAHIRPSSLDFCRPQEIASASEGSEEWVEVVGYKDTRQPPFKGHPHEWLALFCR